MPRKYTLLLILITCSLLVQAQDSVQVKAALLVNEGKMLYRSEMASWFGTDIFVEKCKSRLDKAAGYFSYAWGDSATCIFFSNDTPAVALAAISFDSSYDVKNAVLDSTTRPLTSFENVLHQLRQKSRQLITTDTFFKSYNNAALNIVPLADSTSRKVYVLTGPKVNGVIIFGNDYLLTYNNNFNLVSKKALHRNIIPIEYNTGDANSKDQEDKITMHSHLPETGECMTATDICTLLLYAGFAGWQQHIVVSQNYISIWDCRKKLLATLTREAWERISNDGNNP